MRKGVLFGILAGASWGLVFLSPKITHQFSPLTQMVVRYICYGLFSVGFGMRTIVPLLKNLNTTDWRQLVTLSLQGNIVYYIFLAIGVKYAGIAPTALIIGVLPLTISLMGRNEHDSLPMRQLILPSLFIVAGLTCISADVFINGNETLTSTPSERFFALLCGFGALICWTLYAYGNAQYLRSNPHVSAGDWGNLTGVVTAILAIIILMIGYIISRFQPDHLLALNTDPSLDWLVFIIVGGFIVAFFASWLGSILWNTASQLLPISLTAQLIVSESSFSLLYGFLYDARWPHTLEWAAMGLSITGVLWAIQRHIKAHSKDVLPNSH